MLDRRRKIYWWLEDDSMDIDRRRSAISLIFFNQLVSMIKDFN